MTTFVDVELRHGNSVPGFAFIRSKKSIVYATTINKIQRNNIFSRNKVPKTKRISITDTQQKSVNYFYGTTRESTSAPAIFFSN